MIFQMKRILLFSILCLFTLPSMAMPSPHRFDDLAKKLGVSTDLAENCLANPLQRLSPDGIVECLAKENPSVTREHFDEIINTYRTSNQDVRSQPDRNGPPPSSNRPPHPDENFKTPDETQHPDHNRPSGFHPSPFDEAFKTLGVSKNLFLSCMRSLEQKPGNIDTNLLLICLRAENPSLTLSALEKNLSKPGPGMNPLPRN